MSPLKSKNNPKSPVISFRSNIDNLAANLPSFSTFCLTPRDCVALEKMTATFLTQLRSLLYKNFLLKWREPFTSLLEVCVPLTIIFALVAIHSSLKIEHHDAAIYNHGAIDIDMKKDMEILGLLMASTATKLAIYPSSDLATRFISTLQSDFPGEFRDSIIEFDSEDKFTAYCSDPLYGIDDDYPMVQGGINLVSAGRSLFLSLLFLLSPFSLTNPLHIYVIIL